MIVVVVVVVVVEKVVSSRRGSKPLETKGNIGLLENEKD